MTPNAHARNAIDDRHRRVERVSPSEDQRWLVKEGGETERARDQLKVRLAPGLVPQSHRGFSLIEMVIVLVMIGVLAALAMPDLSVATIRGQIKESGPLIDVAKQGVVRAWSLAGRMPADNIEAGIPESAKMVGKYVAAVTVKDGAVNVTWGNSINGSIKDKVLTLRPAYVEGQPAVPMTWVCASAPVPTGMVLAGADATDMPQKYVPLECQARATGK